MDHLLSKETAVLRGPEPASQDCKVKSGGLRAARVHERLLFSRASSFWIASIFDNRQLEVERELQLIYEIGGERSPP